jgi:uncharacterized protein (TIGR03435 family)
MRNHVKETRGSWRNRILPTAAIVALAVPVFLGLMTASRLQAQSPTGRSPAAAEEKLAFEVGSVKTNKSNDPPYSNVPLGRGGIYTPTGGLFSATNWPLIAYILFAYNVTPAGVQFLLPQLPKWATSDRFDIQARAEGNPTKDQMRLMMQSLLADRYKLVMHYETRQLPVFALVLLKPGKTGPQLQSRSDNTLCSTALPAPGTAEPPTAPGGFPTICGGIVIMQPSTVGRERAGARNVTIEFIANSLPGLGTLDRPILDRTGLSGNFDFVVEWTPDVRPAFLPPNANFTPDPTGPTFLEALQEQLGIKLESTTGLVDVLVVDHVEEPSPN